MKYTIKQGEQGVFRAFDENGNIVSATYAMTVEKCEERLREAVAERKIDTEKVWKEVEL